MDAVPSPSENPGARILRNTLFLTIGDLLARFANLGTVVFLTRTWKDAALYGQYALVVNWVAIFTVLGELGFNALTVREVAHHREKAGYYLRHVMALRALFSLAFWAAMLGAAFLLHYETALVLGLAVLGSKLVLEALSGGYVYLLQAHQEMGTYSAVNILTSLLRFGAIVALVALGSKLTGACGAWVLAGLVALAVLVAIGKKRGWRPRFEEFRWTEAMGVLRRAVPLATFSMFQTLYYRVDTVLLKSLSGNEAVGYYDLATKVLLAALMVSQFYGMALFPVLSSLQDDERAFGRLVSRAVKVLLLAGMPIMVGGALLAGPLLTLVSGPSYGAAGGPFAVLAVSVPPFFLSNIYAGVLAVKDTRRLNFQYVALFLSNVLLNLLLIPRWGTVGAAWATVACEYGGVLLGFCLARPYLGKTPWGSLAYPFAAFTAASALMGLGIHQDPRLYWLALGPAAYLAMVRLFKGLDPEDWAGLKSALRPRKG